ncbi:MAG TPA: ABC transporter permease [Thermoanaerobaculia bacterium]|jgi:putative ABC transport system permease protein|nr:ABC transporter permease [Thermoanaerobaculia bacterium]
MKPALALRRLRLQPGFALAVVLTMALGLGAATAIVAVAGAVLLRPLPYERAEQLVMIEGRYARLGMADLGASAAELPAYRQAHSLAAIAAFRVHGVNLAGGGEPERVHAAQVEAGLFRLLGASPALGRALRPAEEQPGADGVVVLSDGLWRRRFGADLRVLGRTVRLDGRNHLVIGVMPLRFEFPHPSFRFASRADLWVPLALTAEQRADRSSYDLRVIARLPPGVSLAAARAELRAIGRRMEDEHPRDYRGPQGEDGGWGVAVVPFRDEVVGDAGRRLTPLLAAVALLLVIACGNVAALWLARGLARRRELAVRLALGARRRHLALEALAESTVLALLGGALGVLLAWGGTRWLVAAAPASLPRLAELSLDVRVLAFAFLLSLATGAAISLVAPLTAGDGALRARSPSTAGPAGRDRGAIRCGCDGCSSSPSSRSRWCCSSTPACCCARCTTCRRSIPASPSTIDWRWRSRCRARATCASGSRRPSSRACWRESTSSPGCEVPGW